MPTAGAARRATAAVRARHWNGACLLAYDKGVRALFYLEAATVTAPLEEEFENLQFDLDRAEDQARRDTGL